MCICTSFLLFLELLMVKITMSAGRLGFRVILTSLLSLNYVFLSGNLEKVALCLPKVHLARAVLLSILLTTSRCFNKILQPRGHYSSTQHINV